MTKPRSDLGYKPKRVRAWAKRHGIHVASRGPIPDAVVEVYLEAVKSWENKPKKARGPKTPA